MAVDTQVVDAEQLIVKHLDLWTSAQTAKSTAGRGSNNKIELTGIKKLRQLILELAVRGKLVPQDSKDISASNLLEINGAKAIEESLANKLPIGWCYSRISDVTAKEKYSIKRGPFGSALRKDFFVSKGYKVYEQQHAINNDFSLGNYFVSEEKYQELKAFTVKPYDLIVSCSGTVGKVAEAPEWMEPGIINQALLKLTLNRCVLLNSYFKLLFPAFFMRTELLEELSGTAQKNMVSVAELKVQPFPLPPLIEQQRIVAKVDELMALCDQLEQQSYQSIAAHNRLVDTLLQTLVDSANADELASNWQRFSEHFDTLFTTEYSIDALKQTILQLAVMGKLVKQDPTDEPASELLKRIAKEKEALVKAGKIKKQKPLPAITDDEKPFELPSGWEWVRLAEITDIQSGIAKGKQFNSEQDVVELPYLRVANVQRNHLVLDEIKTIEILRTDIEKYSVMPRDLLITEGGDWDKVGRTAVWLGIEGVMLHQNHVFKARPVIDEQNEFWLEKYLNGPQARSYFAGSSKQTTNLASINKTQLSNTIVPVPPITEQKRIIEKLIEFEALIKEITKKIRDVKSSQALIAEVLVEQAVA